MKRKKYEKNTYRMCKNCDFLEYWGFCTDCVCGNYCDRVDFDYLDEDLNNYSVLFNLVEQNNC